MPNLRCIIDMLMFFMLMARRIAFLIISSSDLLFPSVPSPPKTSVALAELAAASSFSNALFISSNANSL